MKFIPASGSDAGCHPRRRNHVKKVMITLGSFHQGSPADPGEGGSTRSGHLLLFVKEFYCSTRTHGGGGGLKIPILARRP